MKMREGEINVWLCLHCKLKHIHGSIAFVFLCNIQMTICYLLCAFPADQKPCWRTESCRPEMFLMIQNNEEKCWHVLEQSRDMLTWFWTVQSAFLMISAWWVTAALILSHLEMIFKGPCSILPRQDWQKHELLKQSLKS